MAHKKSNRLPSHSFGLIQRLSGLRAETLTPVSLAILLLAVFSLAIGSLPGSGSSVTAALQNEGPLRGISAQAISQIDALIEEKNSRSPAQQKIDSNILYEIKKQSGQAIAAGVDTLETGIEVDRSGYILINIKTTSAEVVLPILANLGAEVTNAFEHDIQASVPLNAIEQLASNAEVIFIMPEVGYMTNRTHGVGNGVGSGPPAVSASLPSVLASLNQQGNVFPKAANVSEGDTTHGAATARASFPTANGSGVKVGVLSDGVDSLAALQASGDLPAGITVLAGQAGSGDEGSAMLEIVHDLAPNAQLFFATATPSVTQFAQNIRDLRTAGCNIIIDGFTYLVETPFQNGQAPTVTSPTNAGAVIQAVNDVTNVGVLFFSSAGNSGNLDDGTSGVWEGDFLDGGPASSPIPVAGRLHNFGSQNFDVLTGGTKAITLKWSDPLGGSVNDYDLFLLDSAGTTLIASSTNTQSGTQDPFEFVSSGSNFATNSRIVVVQKTGALGRFLHLNTNRGRLSIATSGVTFGHNAALRAFCVAAAPAHNAFGGPPNPTGPFPGLFTSSQLSELFTSDGPRRIFFSADGTPITANNFSSTGGQLLMKPDITAADGVMCAAPGFNPFFGTSAAAPHAGAIAAMLKSFKFTLTPAEVFNILTTTAIDIEGAGWDRDTGFGIVMANQALASLCSISCPANISQSNDTDLCGAAVTFAATTTGGNCGTVICSPASGTVFPVGTTTVTCTTSAGPSCSFTVKINDTQPPSITCPNKTVGADTLCSGNPGSNVTYSPAVSDNCPGVGAPICNPASGTCFPVGTTTVNCSVTDAVNLSASCTFTVTVSQTCVVICPASVTKPNDAAQCGAVVTYPPPTTAGVCGTVTCSPASGSFFPKGTTTVTCNSQFAGPGQSCSFTVTINDTEAPKINCPANQTAIAQVSCPIQPTTPVSFPNPTVTDNCPGATVACSPPSGSPFPVGVTSVTCTATDTSGNTAQCTFTVTAFSFCLQDDSNAGSVVLINALTGDYSFCCGGVPIAAGRGTLSARGCIGSIDHTKGDRQVHIQWDTSANNNTGAGTAIVQKLSNKTVCQITDKNISNNTCQCSSPPPPVGPKKPPAERTL